LNQPTPPQAVASDSLQYLGKYPRGVDTSRRVMLPSEWRVESAATEFTILLWPARSPEYLLVLPPDRWRQVLERLGQESLTNDSAAAVERFISSNSYAKTLDSYGRLPLPDEAARTAGIRSEAVLVGRINKFEIWEPGRLEANSEKAETQKIFKKLSTLHL
jgi:MraZ protein